LRKSPSCRNGYQNLGQVGKINLKKILDKILPSRSRRIPLILSLALGSVLVGCQGDLGERLQSGKVLAWAGLQGRWAGPAVPADSGCGSTTRGLMSIGEKGFGFDPFQSTTVIHGDIDQSGHLSGKLTREGGDHQPVSVSFEGMAETDSITGTLQSGRCHWNVTLRRG
jgi:hypothetical protein